PDLALPKFASVVFVHGCFWHRRTGCRFTTHPSTRPEFWRTKFASNVLRDKTVREALLSAGWRVATLWECALRKPKQVELAAELLDKWLRSNDLELEIGEADLTGAALSIS